MNISQTNVILKAVVRFSNHSNQTTAFKQLLSNNVF